MAVTDAEVRHVAALARLALDSGRVESLVSELNHILEHMEVLQRVDIRGASLDPDAAQGLRLRDDVPNPIALHREREEFAPTMRDGFFLVPRLATHGDAGTDDAETDG